MNPWLLAAAVFGAIGILTELLGEEKPRMDVLPAPEKKPKKVPPTTVNVNVDKVQSPKEPKQPKVPAKPVVEVPTKPSDG